MEIRKLKPNEFYALRELLDEVFTRSNKRETIFTKEFPRIFGKRNLRTVSHLICLSNKILADTPG
jgi:hypothetical protein